MLPMTMTHEAAQAECARLSQESPDRETHVWFPREGADGEWSVARVAVPAGMERKQFKATVEAKPRPQQAEDPRSALTRNIPPYGPGI
jgi:hypothetical protein